MKTTLAVIPPVAAPSQSSAQAYAVSDHSHSDRVPRYQRVANVICDASDRFDAAFVAGLRTICASDRAMPAHVKRAKLAAVGTVTGAVYGGLSQAAAFGVGHLVLSCFSSLAVGASLGRSMLCGASGGATLGAFFAYFYTRFEIRDIPLVTSVDESHERAKRLALWALFFPGLPLAAPLGDLMTNFSDTTFESRQFAGLYMAQIIGLVLLSSGVAAAMYARTPQHNTQRTDVIESHALP